MKSANPASAACVLAGALPVPAVGARSLRSRRIAYGCPISADHGAACSPAGLSIPAGPGAVLPGKGPGRGCGPNSARMRARRLLRIRVWALPVSCQRLLRPAAMSASAASTSSQIPLLPWTSASRKRPSKRRLAACLRPEIAVFVAIESVGHGLLLSTGKDRIRGMDAAVLNIALDGEAMARGAAKTLAVTPAMAIGGKDGLDHPRAGQTVGIEGRELGPAAAADPDHGGIHSGAVGPVDDAHDAASRRDPPRRDGSGSRPACRGG